jgi:hypothetical protein
MSLSSSEKIMSGHYFYMIKEKRNSILRKEGQWVKNIVQCADVLLAN